MAKFQLQLPWAVRCSLPVAQAAARFVSALVYQRGRGSDARFFHAEAWGEPIPMNIALKQRDGRKDLKHDLVHEAVGRFFFDGGTVVKVALVGGVDPNYGRKGYYWRVEKLSARFWTREYGAPKEEISWVGESQLKGISHLWGDHPHVLPDDYYIRDEEVAS